MCLYLLPLSRTILQNSLKRYYVNVTTAVACVVRLFNLNLFLFGLTALKDFFLLQSIFVQLSGKIMINVTTFIG